MKPFKINRGKSFRLSLLEDESHTKIKTIRFTGLEAVVTAACAVVATVLIIYCLIAFTPLRVTIPGYPSGPAKKLAVENAIKIDSLESIIARWNIYSENLSRVLTGQAAANFDSLVRNTSRSYLSIKDEQELRIQDSLLTQSVRKSERFGLGPDAHRTLPVEGMHFFTPVKGAVAGKFNAISHPYVEITTAAGAIVSSVLDGAVIFSGWDDTTGYTIIIQHEGNIASIYSGCSQALKDIGDRVHAGTPVGMTGNGPGQGTSTLRFELWHNGEALDAARYISF